MEKEIDWYGALAMAGVYLVGVNIILFIIGYALDGEHLGVESHIVVTTLLSISGAIRGLFIPYKGTLQKDDSNDEDYYQAPKQVQYGFDALVILLMVYVFFIL